MLYNVENCAMALFFKFGSKHVIPERDSTDQYFILKYSFISFFIKAEIAFTQSKQNKVLQFLVCNLPYNIYDMPSSRDQKTQSLAETVFREPIYKCSRAPVELERSNQFLPSSCICKNFSYLNYNGVKFFMYGNLFYSSNLYSS